MTKVVYYTTSKHENPVKCFIDSLTEKQKVKIFRIFMLLEKYGFPSIIPHTKKLTDTSLWEIRILGHDNIRIIYITVKNDKILVLHGFVKKKQKTPTKEIATALKRYRDWLDK